MPSQLGHIGGAPPAPLAPDEAAWDDDAETEDDDAMADSPPVPPPPALDEDADVVAPTVDLVAVSLPELHATATSAREATGRATWTAKRRVLTGPRAYRSGARRARLVSLLSMRIDFHYDFSCPYAYLAHTQIEAVAQRAGAELVWKPFLLGGVFRALGVEQVPAASMPAAKARTNLLDMHRFADRLGVPLRMPATHPHRTVLALRATLASGDVPRASKALFRAYWAETRDLANPEVVRAALDAAGFDGAALVAKADEPAVKDELRALTEEAVALGIFGAPATIVRLPGRDPELFWGQDRLDFVERLLGREPPRAPLQRGPSEARRELDFFFDFSSPFAYLGATQIERIAREHGATLRLRPFLLGALFKRIGTPDVPLFAMSEPKRRCMLRELERWSERWGVPFRFPSRFPMNTVKALRLLLGASDEERLRLLLPMFRAYWAEDRDLSDDDTLALILRREGIDPGPRLEAARGQPLREALRVATSEAEAAGVHGVPSFLVTFGASETQLFWGQDRLELVEDALEGWAPSGSLAVDSA